MFRVFGVVEFFVERVLFDGFDAGVVGEFSECGEVVFAGGGEGEVFCICGALFPAEGVVVDDCEGDAGIPLRGVVGGLWGVFRVFCCREADTGFWVACEGYESF